MPYSILSKHSAEGNLLFGVLALQADLITSRQFLEACSAWAARKDTTMADLLVQHGLLTAAHQQEVAGHLERKLARHGGNVRIVLAYLLTNSLQRTWAAVKDPEFRPLLDSLTQEVGFMVARPASDLQQTGQRTSLDERAQLSGNGEAALSEHESRLMQARRWLLKHRTLVNSAVVLLVVAAVVLALAMPGAQPENRPADNRNRWDAMGRAAMMNPKLQALQLVRALFGTLVRKDDVLDHLRRDPALSEPLREQALALAEDYLQHYPQYPEALNNASWFVVRPPHADAAAYRHALLQAQEACRLNPGNGNSLNTLGVAQYRVGLYAEALDTLNKSNQLNTDFYHGPIPHDLAFLAMAHHRLGQKDEARAALDRLEEVMKNPRWVEPRPGASRKQALTPPEWRLEAKAFLREAEDLILGRQENPQK